MIQGLQDWQLIILATLFATGLMYQLHTWYLRLIDTATILAAAAIVAEVRKDDFGELRLMLEIIKRKQGED